MKMFGRVWGRGQEKPPQCHFCRHSHRLAFAPLSLRRQHILGYAAPCRLLGVVLQPQGSPCPPTLSSVLPKFYFLLQDVSRNGEVPCSTHLSSEPPSFTFQSFLPRSEYTTPWHFPGPLRHEQTFSSFPPSVEFMVHPMRKPGCWP